MVENYRRISQTLCAAGHGGAWRGVARRGMARQLNLIKFAN
jgi:hypothetical protein